MYRLSGATFYDCINTIYQFIKSFLDNKMSILEEYGAFKDSLQLQIHFNGNVFGEKKMLSL